MSGARTRPSDSPSGLALVTDAARGRLLDVGKHRRLDQRNQGVGRKLVLLVGLRLDGYHQTYLGTTSTNWPSLPMAAKAGWNPTSTSHHSWPYRASSIRVVASGPSVRARVAGHSNGPRRGRAARSWPCRAREAGSRMRRRIGPVCRSPSRIQPPQNGWSAGPATRNPCRPARVHAQRIEQLLPGVIQQGAGMVAVVAT
jgi:hypothetical protein